MTEDGVFTWVRPAQLLRTQCSSHDSVLDFVFANGKASDWNGKSEILFAEGDYCPDDRETSDHRLVAAEFQVSQE